MFNDTFAVLRVLRSQSRCLIPLGCFFFASPALATVYQYTVSNVPLNNDAGPAQSGFFSGSFLWDTTANAGAGAFSSWDISITKQVGAGANATQTLVQRMISSPGTGVSSGCFKGPDIGAAGALPTAGPTQTYAYAVGVAGSSLCDGETAGVAGKATTLSIYQFGQTINTGGIGTGAYSYFRIALSGSITSQAAGANFAGASYGYAVLASDPTAPTCDFSTISLNDPPAGSCPYASGTQRRQGFQSLNNAAAIQFNTSIVTQDVTPAPGPAPSGAPAPLPLLGAGAAFGWSRRLRRRIREQGVLKV